MARRIRTDIGPNAVRVYKGIPNETNAHLRKEHEITSESQAAQITKYVAEKFHVSEVRSAPDLKHSIIFAS